jgi:hypothetical protein
VIPIRLSFRPYAVTAKAESPILIDEILFILEKPVSGGRGRPLYSLARKIGGWYCGRTQYHLHIDLGKFADSAAMGQPE